MKYNELTRRYFDNAPCAGTLDGRGRFRGEAGDRAQGAWLQFDVRASPGPGDAVIEAVRFLAFGCPHLIAVASWLAEQAPGAGIEPRLPQSVQELRERFAVPTEKTGRLLLVEDAWVAAMRAALKGRVLP
jgi:NifU-like protein involved in Fe-S cluster formation